MKKLLTALLSVSAILSADSQLWAVTPNPLKNAYWRFEEGTNGVTVVPGADNVLDTADNTADPPTVPAHMRAANLNTAPTYTSTVAPFALRSGLANNLALQFTPHSGGGDDLFTRNDGAPNPGPDINNGLIGPPQAPDITGFTIEAAFRPDALGPPFRGIIAKEGSPAGSSEPTLALKVRGDSGNLQFEQFDRDGNRIDVQSLMPLVAGEWYAAAAVNDGSTLSLYLDRNDGNGYILQGMTGVSGGALWQGANGNDWSQAWSIGRAWFGGSPDDWFDGIIDEVRLSNRALAPSEFLFAPIPEPSSIVLTLFGIAGFAWWKFRRS